MWARQGSEATNELTLGLSEPDAMSPDHFASGKKRGLGKNVIGSWIVQKLGKIGKTEKKNRHTSALLVIKIDGFRVEPLYLLFTG